MRNRTSKKRENTMIQNLHLRVQWRSSSQTQSTSFSAVESAYVRVSMDTTFSKATAPLSSLTVNVTFGLPSQEKSTVPKFFPRYIPRLQGFGAAIFMISRGSRGKESI